MSLLFSFCFYLGARARVLHAACRLRKSDVPLKIMMRYVMDVKFQRPACIGVFIAYYVLN